VHGSQLECPQDHFPVSIVRHASGRVLPIEWLFNEDLEASAVPGQHIPVEHSSPVDGNAVPIEVEFIEVDKEGNQQLANGLFVFRNFCTLKDSRLILCSFSHIYLQVYLGVGEAMPGRDASHSAACSTRNGPGKVSADSVKWADRPHTAESEGP
jgi:hypothetical protein